MSTASEELGKLGVHVPEIYLPSATVDYQSWAVVACDQYSSEKEYWEKAAEFVGPKPSTLKMIYPECYLDDGDKNQRIAGIQTTMTEYLSEGCLESRGEGFILVERRTPYEKSPRIGLVLSVDLECYRYGKDSKSIIRPTEGTIVERLPPRMAIRRGAPLELPHIMILMDDPLKSVIEPLYTTRSYLPKLYDFDLMANSGHLRGWQVKGEALLSGIAATLASLADPKAFEAKYENKDLLLFAVGDGNHSLATAKAIWEEVKSGFADRPDADALFETHPARYALVELLNIYDEGLPFHPIHRVLFNVDENAFFAELRKVGARISRLSSTKEAFSACDQADGTGAHRIAYTSSTGTGLIVFENPVSKLAAGTIQQFLDSYLESRKESTIDYIHGSGSLEALAHKTGNLGLYLPPVDKASFFATVIQNGVMPRKTFSMGEAPEKRFYVEARKIKL